MVRTVTEPVGTRGAAPAPLSLADLAALRTDYEDVTCPDMGDAVLRLYALSGTARAQLVPAMADLAGTDDDDARSPDAVRRVFQFEVRVVASCLGYPEAEWDAAGDALGAPTVELLYPVAARLSKLDRQEVDAVAAEMGKATSEGSGTDSPSP
jgi:hypothetical protein